MTYDPQVAKWFNKVDTNRTGMLNAEELQLVGLFCVYNFQSF